jgi:hypothetical protein
MVDDAASEPRSEPQGEREDEHEDQDQHKDQAGDDDTAEPALNPQEDVSAEADARNVSPVVRFGQTGGVPGYTGIDVSGMVSALGAIAAASGAYKDMQERMFKNLVPAIAAINAQTQLSVQSIAKSISNLNSVNLYPSMDAITALLRHMSELPALTQLRDYAALDDPASAYSPEMESPLSYFETTEEVITCFDDLHAAISRLITKTPDLPLVWRGVRNADWGLHSHLYRQLMIRNGVEAPSSKPTHAQPYPDENQMVAAEREILRIARGDWRFDHLSALETFARIQHAGGPTRLIDVSKNPYIGAWFAVESDPDEEDQDARLFALATRPVAQDGKPVAPDSTLQLDDLGASRDPFWHLLSDSASRQQLDWGTGARRRIWVPPAYDPRISAQNAAFILDGVPMTSARTAPYFKIEGSTYWRRADLLASGSIYAKMFRATAKP